MEKGVITACLVVYSIFVSKSPTNVDEGMRIFNEYLAREYPQKKWLVGIMYQARVLPISETGSVARSALRMNWRPPATFSPWPSIPWLIEPEVRLLAAEGASRPDNSAIRQ